MPVGRGRGRLQETDRPEEGQAPGLPLVTDGRIRDQPDSSCGRAQDRSEEKAADEEAEEEGVCCRRKDSG